MRGIAALARGNAGLSYEVSGRSRANADAVWLRAHCHIFEMYDAEAKPTEDPDQAIAAVVKVGDDQFILLNLTGEETARLH